MIGNWFGKERSFKMSGQLNCKDLFSKQVEMRNWEAPVSSSSAPVLSPHSWSASAG